MRRGGGEAKEFPAARKGVEMQTRNRNGMAGRGRGTQESHFLQKIKIMWFWNKKKMLKAEYIFLFLQ